VTGANLALETAAAGYPVRKLAMVEPMYRLPGAPTLAPDYQEHIIELTSAGDMDEVVKYSTVSSTTSRPRSSGPSSRSSSRR
jgi:predicted esterase